MADGVVAERGKSLRTIMASEGAYHTGGLVSGLLLRSILAATACMLVGTTVLPKANRRTGLDVLQFNDTKLRRRITLTSSRKVFSYSETLWFRRIHELEYIAVRSNEK